TAVTKKYIFDEVFDSQKVYRLLLDAMSNPTRIVSIAWPMLRFQAGERLSTPV
ncbi:MAG: hypothetical protein EOM14_03920, partial [Clostridia bacterium]|nr:hypothetical protein [Clostridia bacterium]